MNTPFFATLKSLFRMLPLAASLIGTVALAEDDWIELFDGASLKGWKASENVGTFKVEGGSIAADGPRSHLFYVGSDGQASFENFEFSAEVKAKAGANSGVFFHTQWQESGWPEEGFEIQVNNSQLQHGNYLELKKTGSLYGIRNLYKTLIADDAWYTLNILVQKPGVQVRINGMLVVDYVDPERPLPEGSPELNRLGQGTFALQGHDPESRAFFRNLRVRELPPSSDDALAVSEPVDAAGAQLLSLARNNFPLIDLHTHLKGGLELENALEISRRTGVGLGIAVNGGKGFPVQNDAAALSFLESMKGQPVFVALQAEGREWMDMFSLEAIARFDYVFTDSMTFTNAAGKRLRLWIPEESDIGDDVEAFMDELAAKTAEIIATEPIDIYVNPTYLPASIAADYDRLWTKQRMKQVIDAAVENSVAIEINGRFRLPSERFLRLAKSASAKFTFGTNNGGAEDFGEWSYPLEMQKKLALSWQDMYVPGHAPSRSQKKLAQTGL